MLRKVLNKRESKVNHHIFQLHQNGLQIKILYSQYFDQNQQRMHKISHIIIKKQEKQTPKLSKQMSVYTQQHRRNFSLLTPKLTQTSIPYMRSSVNRSLHKIQTNSNNTPTNKINPNFNNNSNANINNHGNNYSWLLIAAKQYYHKTNNLHAAIKSFEEYLSYNPNHQQSLYLCAVCYMNIAEYNKAISKLKLYLSACSNAANLTNTTRNNNNSNNNSSYNNNNRKLIINSSQALPNVSQAYLLLSMAYSKTDNLDKSLSSINQALKNDNRFQQALCFRAKLYLKFSSNEKYNNAGSKNKYKEKAFYDYKNVLKINQHCWTAWVGLGDYYMEIHNYQQAYKSYNTAKKQLQNQKKRLRTQEIEQNEDIAYPIFKDQRVDQKYNFQNSRSKHNGVFKEHSQQKYISKSNFSKKKSLKTHAQELDKNEIHQNMKKLALKSITSPSQKQQFGNKQLGNAKFFQSAHTYTRQKHNLNLNFNVNLNVNLNVNITPKSRQKSKNKQIDKNRDRSQKKIQAKMHQSILQIGKDDLNTKSPNPITQFQKQKDTINQLDLKIAICSYFLGQYSKSINLLQNLLSQKVSSYYTQIYYYIAVNQLKIYEQLKIKKKSSIQTGVQKQMTSFKNAKPLKGKKQIYFYSSCSPAQLLQYCILNLQSSINANNNHKIIVKACKTLIKVYIQNNQFYQTQSVIKLAEKYNALDDIKHYKMLSEATMMVIKQKYQQAIPMLKRLYDQIINNDNKINNKSDTINNDTEQNKQKQMQKQKQKQKDRCSSLRISANDKSYKLNTCSNRNANMNLDKSSFKVKKTGSNQFDHSRLYVQQQQNKQEIQKQQLYFSTGGNKSHKVSINKQKEKQKQNQKQKETINLNQECQEQIDKDQHYNQFKNIVIKNRFQGQEATKLFCNKQAHSSSFQTNNHINQHTNKINELQWMIPLILLFRAYSQYFSDNFIQCLEIYEHYQNYIKDYLGKQPETDIYLCYNKIMCEGILMLDNDMIEESLQKFMACIQNYYNILKGVAVEPILFRVLAMIRLSLSDNPILSKQVNSRTKIFKLILQMLQHYIPAINNNCLVHYYNGLVLYQLQRYKQASESVQKCLKQAEECTWKFLYTKGVIQIKNGLYKQAVRQFSAGMLVQQKADLYLGRCISYIQLFDQSQGQHNALMQKSFEDLQKFIQLQQNKDKISKWVTKILFFNRAYEQVTKSIKKISSQSLESDQDLVKIQKSINIYNGIFEDGGVLGQILINAFQGKFAQNIVQINQQQHQILMADYVQKKYLKWLHILNFYAKQRYPELIKFLQFNIFQEKDQQQISQLRYNLAIVYYLSDQSQKADNVLSSLAKHNIQLAPRIQKFISRQFQPDQCIQDLQNQFKGVKRLSSLLPYRRANTSSKIIGFIEKQKSIHLKISIPFPNFFKPDISLSLDDSFIYSETAQTCIPKKIQAPWIKKITGNVQFTDNILQSQNTSFFDQDILTAQQQQSLNSQLKNF